LDLAAREATRSPPPTRRLSRPAARRGLELFAERGYHDTSISHIIESASVARGTFYQYFKSKREICEDLLDQLFEEVSSSVSPIPIGTPEASPARCAPTSSRCAARCRSTCPWGRVLLEQAVGLDDAGRKQLREFYLRVLDRIERAVRVGQKLGIVRPGDPSLIAVCLLAMVKESLYQQIIGTRSCKVTQVVNEIFECVERGVLLIRLPGPAAPAKAAR